jgi:hypothetical protein
MGDCKAGLKKKCERAGIKCHHIFGCPPEEPFLACSIVDRKVMKAPDDNLPPDEIKKASQGIRDRMQQEEVHFAALLKRLKGKNG